MAKIIICHPDGNENKYGLQGDKFTIGRAPDNDIVLPDGSSSNRHAVLEITENGEYTVTDLGSTNHTQVNGTKVSTKALRHEDRILFGDTLAIYHATDPEAVPTAEETVVAPSPPPPPKKAPAETAQPPSTQTPAEGTGCLGLFLATAIPAVGYLLLR